MTEYYDVSEDVLTMAQDIINCYHPSLLDAKIGFCFRDEAPQSNGKLTLGQASKVTPKYRPLLREELDFVIWLAKDVWDELSPHQRMALIDHELCHCDYKLEEGKAKVVPHDIEEFWVIIQRYGLWRPSLQEGEGAMEKALQMKMSVSENRGMVVSVESLQ